MEKMCFDSLTRSLTEPRTRRDLTRLLSGIAFGGAPVLLGLAEAQAKRKKTKRKNRKKKRGGSAAPPPVPVLTCQCPGPREVGHTSGASSEVTRLAQTFTAAQSGPLHQIRFEVDKDAGSPGDYVVELLAVGGDGKPTNTVLAQTTIPNAAVPAGTWPLTANFSGPSLVAGTAYAAAISRPGTTKFGLNVSAINAGDCVGSVFNQESSGTGPFNERPVDDLIIAVTVLV